MAKEFFRQSHGQEQASRGKGWAAQIALERYHRSKARAWLGRAWSRFIGRCHCLLSLADMWGSGSIRGSHYGGIQSVPIQRIVGSEGRTDDFDAAFRPLQAHTEARWLGIAAAWYTGAMLPPVELIQVGDHYFVRDGHHRLSVARAFGQRYIDAEVTVWELASPEQPA